VKTKRVTTPYAPNVESSNLTSRLKRFYQITRSPTREGRFFYALSLRVSVVFSPCTKFAASR